MNNASSVNKSNTKNIPKIPKSILVTGKLLQTIAPPLATKFALKLFSTPIKFKVPEREKMMAKSAQQDLVLIPELQEYVNIFTYGYSKRKVLLVHGWSGRNTQFFKISDKLLENGFMTIGYDAPAHGKSSGKTSNMTEFIAVNKFLQEKYGPFEIVIGHSLGGMAVLNSMQQFLNVKKAIVIGSGNIITHIIEDFIAKIQLKEQQVVKMKSFYLKKFGKDIDEYSSHIAAKDIKTPTLVIHDTEDKEVPITCAYEIRKKLEFGELLVTSGLGHTRILKDNSVVTKIIDFIKKEV
ncbi:MAG: alpha/beta hydrolase [Lutibacter sp.]|nr:alpha/beta hydrolase [Lutibacter sp.]MBP9600996.1 alpha/beta hydrolase [Lutibacter sp.]